jgi:hypothetical protein
VSLLSGGLRTEDIFLLPSIVHTAYCTYCVLPGLCYDFLNLFANSRCSDWSREIGPIRASVTPVTLPLSPTTKTMLARQLSAGALRKGPALSFRQKNAFALPRALAVISILLLRHKSKLNRTSGPECVHRVVFRVRGWLLFSTIISCCLNTT